MASTEGAPIPRAYGRVRLAGQVIWATQLEEVVTQDTATTGGKGGPTARTTTTTYSYFANLAIGLCEGPIATVLRSLGRRQAARPHRADHARPFAATRRRRRIR